MSGQTTASASVAAPVGWLGHRLAARFGLLLVAGLGFAVGVLGTDAAETARVVAADPDLAVLLRAMAGLKVAMAAVAVGGMVWRLGSPIGAVRLGLYGVATAAMAAGPALIWGLVHVGWGTALLHGGLLGAVVALWRDPAVGARLQRVIEGRRRG